MAVTTSSAPTCSCSNLRSSSQMRMLRCRYPPIITSPLPSTVRNLSRMLFFAYSLISCCDLVPESEIHMMGFSSGLVLLMIGGSMSLGRFRAACATRACTCCNATSTLRDSSNSTLIVAEPSLLVDVISRMPSTAITASSSTSTTSVSIVSGDAPSSTALMVTNGTSMSGYCPIGKPLKDPTPQKLIAPKTMKLAINIQAKTGLRIEVEAKLICPRVVERSSPLHSPLANLHHVRAPQNQNVTLIAPSAYCLTPLFLW